jgi:hypothetical protein
MALATFLIRGGIVWFLVPIIALPTPVGLANAFGPSILEFVFGGLSLALALLVAAGILAILVWILGGGSVAAVLEVAMIRIVATDEDVVAVDGPGPAVADDRAARVLAVRLLVLVPLLGALVFGAVRIVGVTYAELTLPSDTASIAWRVVRAVPEAVALIALTWVGGEILGGLAARRIVLGPPSVSRALGRAALDLIRHPLRTIVLYLAPTAVLLLVLIPAAAAASVAWTGVRSTLAEPGAGPGAFLALLAFLALWAGGLVLTGAVCAWRHAVWTVASVTRGRGTFGGSPTGRPGDWNSASSSGTF